MNHLNDIKALSDLVMGDKKECNKMLDPKEVMMELADEALAEFDEKHGRPPTAKEEEAIAQAAFDGIGDYYADIGDRARDMAKGN